MSLREHTRPLRRGLAALRRRVRSLVLVLGVSRVLVFLVTILAAYFCADYFLRLPLNVRRVACLGVAVGLAYVCTRRLFGPLTAPLGDALLAARVEARHPELRDRLSSTLAFSTAEPDPDNGDSQELMRAVVEETVGMADAIPFRDVAQSRTTLRWATGAGALLVAAAVAVLSQPALAATFLQRDLLLRDVSWPRRTTLTVVDMTPGVPRKVTLGRELAIQVRAEGSLPDRVELRYWEERGSESEAEEVELAPTPDDATLFSFSLGINTSYRFTVRGGDDDRREVYRITALTPPALLSLAMECEYPEYLGKTAETLAGGDQTLPEGTKARLRVETNMPLARAFLGLGEGNSIPLEPDGDDRRFAVDLPTERNLRYTLRLVGRNGEENAPGRDSYRLVVRKDRKPLVRVHTPRPRTERLANGLLLVGTSARDDYRIDAVRLHCKVNDGKERTIRCDVAAEPAVAGVRARLADGASADYALGLVVIDLARLRRDDGSALAKGDVVTFRVDATDSAGRTQATRGDFRCTLIAEEDLVQGVESRQQDLRESANRAGRSAGSATAAVEELRGLAEKANEFRRATGTAQARQARLIDDLDSIARQVRQIVNLYVFNRLGDASAVDQILPFYERHLLDLEERSATPFRGALYRALWKAHSDRTIRASGSFEKLLEMADLSDRLVADHGPAAYKALARLAGRERPDDPVPVLDEVDREQAAIVAGLERLHRLMREWQSYESVVRFFKTLREIERGVVEELGATQKNDNR